MLEKFFLRNKWEYMYEDLEFCFQFFPGLCMLSAVGITAYDTNNSDADIEYGLSFILACVCLVFALVAGIIFAFAKPKKSGSQGRVIHPM